MGDFMDKTKKTTASPFHPIPFRPDGGTVLRLQDGAAHSGAVELTLPGHKIGVWTPIPPILLCFVARGEGHCAVDSRSRKLGTPGLQAVTSLVWAAHTKR